MHCRIRQRLYRQTPEGKEKRKRERERYRVKYRVRKRGGLRAFVDEIKMLRGCADCGLKPKYAAVLDFDHVRGEKCENVSVLVRHRCAGQLVEEIDKCDVVCANCHRIRTVERRLGSEREVAQRPDCESGD
jgi:hypothetical protein